MSENAETPSTDAPANNNRTLIIVIVVLLILCCCCAIFSVLGWQFGDAILYELGLY